MSNTTGAIKLPPMGRDLDSIMEANEKLAQRFASGEPGLPSVVYNALVRAFDLQKRLIAEKHAQHKIRYLEEQLSTAEDLHRRQSEREREIRVGGLREVEEAAEEYSGVFVEPPDRLDS